MTITEAIRIKTVHGDEFSQIDPDDFQKANELSIEALKAVEKIRRYPFPDELLLLPGETQE